MFVLLILIVTVLGALYFRINKRDWLNPATIFLLVWAIVVFLASLHLFDLADISDRAYLYILIGVFCFFVGSIFGDKVKITVRQTSIPTRRETKQFTYKTNYTFFTIASIIIIAFCIWRLANIVILLASGSSWWEIRLMATSGESGVGTLRGGALAEFLHDAVVAPLLYLLAPTWIAELLIGERKRTPLILGIIAIVLYSIVTVSRAIWAFLILYAIIILLYYRKRFHLPSRIRKALRFVPIFVVALIVVILLITALRSDSGDVNILENIYAYIAGALPLFSTHLEEGLSSIRTYGMLSLGGFLYPVMFVLNYVGILKYPLIYTNAILIKNNLETFISIAPGINMNAYATLFYDFYIDFGVIGIIAGSFIFGLLCIKAYKAFKRNENMRNLVIYLILLQFIIFSVARMYTSLSTRALSFIWLFLMFEKVSNTEEIQGEDKMRVSDEIEPDFNLQ